MRMRKLFVFISIIAVLGMVCLISFVDSELDTDAESTAVDLGLPSGTLWATCNVGATSPEQTGLYFAWGETTGFTAADVTAGTRKFNEDSYKAASISTDLTLEQDAAHVNLGGNWRMPTKDEWQELFDYCDVTWVSSYRGKDVAGRVFTSKVNGNSVFFPAAGYCSYAYSYPNRVNDLGYYWSASWNSSSNAWYLGFEYSNQTLRSDNGYRELGQSVRGVLSFPSPPAESTPVDLGLPSGLKWAEGNVGATSAEQAGLYFGWGETTGYTAADVTAGVREFTEDKYNAGSAASISADLTLEQDAAHANLGGNWRMPTDDEYQELLDNCDAVWTTDYKGTGGKGCIFTSKVNGNSVFFPAAGYCRNTSVRSVGSRGSYWSVSWDSPSYAWLLNFESGRQYLDFDCGYYGRSVRGVCE